MVNKLIFIQYCSKKPILWQTEQEPYNTTWLTSWAWHNRRLFNISTIYLLTDIVVYQMSGNTQILHKYRGVSVFYFFYERQSMKIEDCTYYKIISKEKSQYLLLIATY